MSTMIKVLFVCLGNICRSPTAEALFRARLEHHGLADAFVVDSAGTSGMQAGRPPDPRAQAVARRRGLDLSGLRARQVRTQDFARFDHVLAMDRANLADLRAACPSDLRERIGLLLEKAGSSQELEVVDPYYGHDMRDFETMFDVLEAASDGLLRRLRAASP